MQSQGFRASGRKSGVLPSRREPSFSIERPVGAILKRENRRWLVRTPRLGPDLAFLAASGVPRAVLDLASRLAAIRGTDARAELFATGFDRERYWSLLAEHLGLDYLADLGTAELIPDREARNAEILPRVTSVLVRIEGVNINVRAPDADAIARLASDLTESPGLADRVRIASPEAIRALVVAKRQNALSAFAVDRLWRILPRLSARRLGGGGDRPVVLVSAAAGLALLAPTYAIATLMLVAVIFFANCSYWRLAAAFGSADRLRVEPLAGEFLPTYTVLAPLYREAAVIPDLVRHLTSLDYPALCIKRTIADPACSPDAALPRNPDRKILRGMNMPSPGVTHREIDLSGGKPSSGAPGVKSTEVDRSKPSPQTGAPGVKSVERDLTEAPKK